MLWAGSQGKSEHASAGLICKSASYGSTEAHSRRGRGIATAAPFTVSTNLVMSCGAGLGSSSLPVSSRHCSSSDLATVSAVSPRVRVRVRVRIGVRVSG